MKFAYEILEDESYASALARTSTTYHTQTERGYYVRIRRELGKLEDIGRDDLWPVWVLE